jgi:4-amino-4-deoxy-L-arabinose transferase-like glycosyltransferase
MTSTPGRNEPVLRAPLTHFPTQCDLDLAHNSSARLCDRFALVTLAAAGVIALMTFRDYGLGWDDYAHSEYGELLLSFYRSVFSDTRALSFVNLYKYGGGFDILSAIAAKILPFTLFETRRLMGAAVGVAGLLVTWRLARRIGGPVAGLAALVLLATCPLYVGHLFMNAKDGPFAVAMAILLLGLVRCFEEYPRPNGATIALFGLGLGLSVGSRIMGLFGIIYALAALALLLGCDSRENGPRAATARLARFCVALLPGFALAYVAMGVVWPWSVVDPLNPLRAITYFSHFFEEPWRELYNGELILVLDMPRDYLPTLLALTLPEVFLAFGVAGVAIALIGMLRGSQSANRRAITLLVLAAGTVPVLTAVMARPAMYNGIRHFLFVLPPLAVLGGLAAARVLEWTQRQSVAMALAVTCLFAAGAAAPATAIARLHPYGYTYFNALAGGVPGARDKFMLDYWGLSFKQVSLGLKQRISALALRRPNDRPWRLAVCGPHRSPQVELGPGFETSWDPQKADFAMVLGEFYCAELDAPVMVEVAREGVVYARVYDLRERSFSTLLDVPRSRRGPFAAAKLGLR